MKKIDKILNDLSEKSRKLEYDDIRITVDKLVHVCAMQQKEIDKLKKEIKYLNRPKIYGSKISRI